MTTVGSSTTAVPVELLDEMERDHDAMRMRILELLSLLENAVTAQVDGERRIAELTEQCHRQEVEIEALHNTRLFRAARPFRRAYARVRAATGRAAA